MKPILYSKVAHRFLAYHIVESTFLKTNLIVLIVNHNGCAMNTVNAERPTSNKQIYSNSRLLKVI